MPTDSTTPTKAENPHYWRCDCEWCWIGVTTGKKPPTLWQRFRALLAQRSKQP